MSAESDFKRKYETQLQLNERMAREFDNLKIENNEQKISKISFSSTIVGVKYNVIF